MKWLSCRAFSTSLNWWSLLIQLARLCNSLTRLYRKSMVSWCPLKRHLTLKTVWTTLNSLKLFCVSLILSLKKTQFLISKQSSKFFKKQTLISAKDKQRTLYSCKSTTKKLLKCSQRLASCSKLCLASTRSIETPPISRCKKTTWSNCWKTHKS